MVAFVQWLLDGNAGLWCVWNVRVCFGVKLPVSDFDQRACTSDEPKRDGGRFDDAGTVDWLYDGNSNRIDHVAIWNWSSPTLDHRAAAFSASFDARHAKTRPTEHVARCQQF